MEFTLGPFRILAEYEPLTLKAAVRKEAQSSLVRAVKLVRDRRPQWSLKEAYDYVKRVVPVNEERGPD